jgi:hypothetical protein
MWSIKVPLPCQVQIGGRRCPRRNRRPFTDYAELDKSEGVAPGLPLGLPDGSRTVQVRHGETQVKNGTYLAEGAGGYFVYEAESMEAAIALAARIPAARLGGAVEIRPAEKYW